MGSRLGVFVRSGSGWDIYYDHWSAYRIGRDIAVDGFEKTMRRFRWLKRWDVSGPEDWNTATWLEGSLVIDTVARAVVWAEEAQGLYLPRLINYLTEYSWPGWTAIWSPEDIYGTLRAVGVNPTSMLEPSDEDREPWGIDDSLYPSAYERRYDVLTVRLASGELISWPSDFELERIAHYGPLVIAKVAQDVFRRFTEGRLSSQEMALPTEPESGVVVDYTTKHLRWWSLYNDQFQVIPFDLHWPGWKVETRGDDFAWQEQLVGSPLRNWQSDLANLRREIDKTFEEANRADPDPLGDLRASDRQIADSMPTRDLSRAAFHRLIDRIEDTPVPAARFIDRFGVIRTPSE